MSCKHKLIIGISGASGIVYGIRALFLLRQYDIESHLIVTRNALTVLRQEVGITKTNLYKLADKTYSFRDIGAKISSGSYLNDGMLIAPCSIRTMSEIAAGITSSLMTRAADVTLKEKRTLVLMVRETPLHIGHLRKMIELTEMGAIIMPPVPAYYMHPKTVDDIINYTVIRALNLFRIKNIGEEFCWSGMVSEHIYCK
ncbi:UbiX family flavin prenyltransferase [Blochmannia endosymbiont of Polyrhachis (Hedomyrma) turneri]|uniref:UbiX family flavin prenyltransferase n=1 Tax=Blochmannia endosymbiont of Polyrhachis (Hedomyrma) turneri TaxID=1505596 RepID=UPI00061A719F|nr:UbiX family flavin prenyltransferase [Blochmannia endosymbiont of Polyrhachis (Hedomyrma) turneri]AKC59941.1 3-octaprenyl-4-hydroxybenzoate carboxy-lyase [Blochmannia endosymbiont of Polyrhachis (Hedomyrma) turneri]